ncbi:uncharacterized protein [Nicotiana sylvestris]|uniref:uncharacterized protein n=1 Tax=Nicotiana sylvestris TaxID=4096 RepID=UPI00388CD164
MTGSKNQFLSLEDLKRGNVYVGNGKKYEIIGVVKEHEDESIGLVKKLSEVTAQVEATPKERTCDGTGSFIQGNLTGGTEQRRSESNSQMEPVHEPIPQLQSMGETPNRNQTGCETLQNLCAFDASLSLIEPKNVAEALQDADLVNAMVVENLIEQEKIVLRDEEVPNVTNNPLPAHNNEPLIGMICEDKEFDPALKAIIAIVDTERKPKAAPKQEKGEKKTNTVKAELEKKAETKTETMLPSKNEVLYIPRGQSEKPQIFEMKRGIPMYVVKGAYVVRGTIKPPRLNELVVIGRVPQKPMEDSSMIPWNYQQTLVTYKGKEITGELPENTSAGRYSDIQEVNNATRKRFPPEKPVSAEEAEAFFQKMNMPDYEVLDQLRKYPEHVSMLSLLMRSAEHQKILLKTLNEAYVPVETSVEQLERMTERFFAVNQVSFSKNDLPPEGATHNKALHLTVKCEDYYVKRVMLDGGSGVDICPLSTLQRMKIGIGRIRPNNVCVRAFDGIKRDTFGEIDLILTIGPVEFEVTFQVLDMDTSYNFLLRRPWIHAAGAVPSTLHQMVKFEYEDREIVVHREDELSIYRDPSIPYLEAREGSEHTVYQAFEVVLAEQYEEGSPCPQPLLSNASIMVAKQMI